MNYIQELISQMTLEEKSSLCSGLNYWHLKGVERLGVPSIMVADGPHGLRKQEGDPTEIGLSNSAPATCFPTASALAATWNKDLIFEVGEALGEECRQEKVGVILGPGANIKRSPLCGRNFEYFSEDPYLSGEIAKSYIKGVQSQGIGTSLKHFAVNNQEYRRMTIDAIVDERALREIYLAGYEIAVKGAKPWTLMGAYNRLNGTYACEHSELLREILKEEWAHEGLVMTDWGAMNERVAALETGLELEMPGVNNGNDELIIAAVESGDLDISILDHAVERILALIFKAEKTLSNEYTFDQDAHHALARQVAGEGAVLLKNENRLLPLTKGVKVALIGDMAVNPRYQGAGSSLVNPIQLDTIYDEILDFVGQDLLSYTPGYTPKGLDVELPLIKKAVEIAREAQVVVICAGLPENFETEGLDRDHMKLPDSHNRLIEAISNVHRNVVVVLNNGSPVEMPWIDKVQAILEGYLGGQAGAGAITDILFGITNPSGKLAETFPIKLEDHSSFNYFPGGPKTVEYRESIYVGYRFFDTVGKNVLFPFGHGLSYTEFKYSDLQLSKTKMTDQETLQIRLKVKNSGEVAGKEVVQVYVSPQVPDVFRPTQELKGFVKVSLEPGEEKEISLGLDHRAFAYFNTALGDWHVGSGFYGILIGASSRDIRLKDEVQIESSQPDAPISERDMLPVYRDFPSGAVINREDFEKLLDRALPDNIVSDSDIFTLKTPLEDMTGTFIGRQLMKVMENRVRKMTKDDPEDPMALLMQAMIKTMPLRTLLIMGGGAVNREMLDGLLVMLNGQFYVGLSILLRGARNK